MRGALVGVVVSMLLWVGCGDGGDSDASGTSDGGNRNDGGTGGGSEGGTRPPPGPSAEGWQSDFAKAAGIRCDAAASEFAALPSVTVGTSTMYVGFRQATSINQNPIVARFDDGELVYCVEHEDDPPDARAVGITWNGGDHAYVVYTVVGGGTDLEGKGGFLSSYAPGAISGGGPNVSVVGRVAAATGELETATFVIAVKSDNKVNTHNPAGAVRVLEDGTVEFLGESAHKPIDADGRSAMNCTDYPFESRYRFSADLRTLVCADCTNCQSQRPCP